MALKDKLTKAIGLTSAEYVKVDDKNRFYYMLQQMQSNRWRITAIVLGHDRRYSVDITKISKLGWKRTRSLDEALQATVNWYRDNRWWWEPLKAKK